MISELVYDVCPNFWPVKKLVKQLQLGCPQEAKVLGGEKMIDSCSLHAGLKSCQLVYDRLQSIQLARPRPR